MYGYKRDSQQWTGTEVGKGGDHAPPPTPHLFSLLSQKMDLTVPQWSMLKIWQPKNWLQLWFLKQLLLNFASFTDVFFFPVGTTSNKTEPVPPLYQDKQHQWRKWIKQQLSQDWSVDHCGVARSIFWPWVGQRCSDLHFCQHVIGSCSNN